VAVSRSKEEVRKLGTAQGGAYADGTRFQFAGGPTALYHP
jgi:hypothetical protein